MLLKKLSTNEDLMSVIGRGEYGACVISVLYNSGDGGDVGNRFAPPIAKPGAPKCGPCCKCVGNVLVAPPIRNILVLISCVSTFFKKNRWNRDESAYNAPGSWAGTLKSATN